MKIQRFFILFFLAIFFSPVVNAKTNINLFYFTTEPEIITKADKLIKSYGSSLNVGFMKHDAQKDPYNQTIQIDSDFKFGDAAIVVTTDTHAARSAIEQSRKKNSPLVFTLFKPIVSFLTYSNTWFVGLDDNMAGEVQANMIAQYSKVVSNLDKNQNGVLDMVIIRGEKNTPETLCRSTSLVSSLMQLGFIANPLAESYGDWSFDDARRIVANVIKKETAQNIEVIVANSDKMALGALKALQDAGFNKGDPQKYVPIFGIYGDEAAIKAIDEGFMTGTAVPDIETLSKVCVDIVSDKKITHEKLSKKYKIHLENKNILIPYSPYKKF